MAFFTKNTGGPDPIGGLFPQSDSEVRCMNRSGSAVVQGEVVMLDFAASAAELTTNDSNTYRAGYGDAAGDSVWNTVVNPDTAAIVNGTAFFGVCTDVSVADNAIGNFQFFGIVELAFVQRTGSLAASALNAGGRGLTVTAAATSTFDAVVTADERVVAIYLDSQDRTLTNRELKRIFLHNGVLGGSGGTALT
jgi:hypothetical protein